MDPKLKAFLEKKQETERKERDKLLTSLALVNYEKEYSPTGKKTGPYVHFDKDQNNYYMNKTTPIQVTDEEYEQIKKYVEPKKKTVDGTEGGLKVVNGFFWIFAILAFIVILTNVFSVLSGEHLSQRNVENVWQQSVAVQQESVLISSIMLVVLGLMFIGMCFVTKLLLKIVKNQNEINAKLK